MSVKGISGNLEYDLAVAISKYEEESPIAAKVIEMVNGKLSQIDLINLYVGTIDALFVHIKTLEKENLHYRDVLNHPLFLNALIADRKKLEEEEKAKKLEKEEKEAKEAEIEHLL